MIPGVTAFGEEAYSQLPPTLDYSVLSPFTMLLDDDEAERVYLLIATPYDHDTGTETNIYVSSHGYITKAADTPASTLFEARLSSPFNFSSSLFNSTNLSGSSSFGAGDITIKNNDGEYDNLLNHGWDGRSIEVKMGTKDFSFSEFGTVFRGTADQLVGNENELSIRLRDRQAVLSQPIQTTLYAGTGSLEGSDDLTGKPKPLAYGECLNITPPLVDQANSIYQIHNGSIQSVDVVYFAGVVATLNTDYTVNLANGTITLLTNPSGAVTCDVKGDNSGTGYVSSTADIIRRIAADQGGLIDPADLDLATFQLVNGINSSIVGIYTGISEISIATVFDWLISSIGGYWSFTRVDQLKVGIVTSPGTSKRTIDGNDIKSIRVDPAQLPSYRTKVGYNKVWTVQQPADLAGSVTAARQQFVKEEYRYAVNENLAIQSQHKLAQDRQIKALFSASADAQTESDRQQLIHGVHRRLYDVDINGIFYDVEDGDVVKLEYPRFGLNAGKSFLIIQLSENAKTNASTMGLWG